MIWTAGLLTLLAAFIIIRLSPLVADAHCDTMDGPAVKDGMKALDTGNINYALKWIAFDDEAEIREIFARSLKVRKLSEDAKELADRYFLENMIRIHRVSEGAPYDGLKPSGTRLDEKVLAADASIDSGELGSLLPLIEEEKRPELERRFRLAISKKNFKVDDVVAGRAYIEAYISFFKFAEGEEDEHHPVTHQENI